MELLEQIWEGYHCHNFKSIAKLFLQLEPDGIAAKIQKEWYASLFILSFTLSNKNNYLRKLTHHKEQLTN